MKSIKTFCLFFALALPITITAHNIGQTHVDWQHSGLDVQGNPTDLTGFVISCGPVSGQYTVEYNLPDGAARHATVAELGLADGVWYCQHVALNHVGASPPSTETRFRLAGGLPVVEGVPAAPSDLVLAAN